ncbi:hypothetical protein Stok01_01904 [Sulfurisphaera tokodaii]
MFFIGVLNFIIMFFPPCPLVICVVFSGVAYVCVSVVIVFWFIMLYVARIRIDG